MNRSVAEMATVAEALALTRFHIFSHSWGGMLAQQYVLDKAPDAVSLTIANSTASIPGIFGQSGQLEVVLGRGNSLGN